MTEKLIKALAEIEKASVEVGHFSDQGNHSTAIKPNGTPYSYVELMYFHHTGDAGSRPPRQPLSILKIQNRNLSQHRWMRSNVKLAIKDILVKTSLSTSMRRIGKNIVTLEKEIFGDPILLAGTPNNTDPLIDTGELRSKVTHKVNINGSN